MKYLPTYPPTKVVSGPSPLGTSVTSWPVLPARIMDDDEYVADGGTSGRESRRTRTKPASSAVFSAINSTSPKACSKSGGLGGKMVTNAWATARQRQGN
jgi:hypothetical protein